MADGVKRQGLNDVPTHFFFFLGFLLNGRMPLGPGFFFFFDCPVTPGTLQGFWRA